MPAENHQAAAVSLDSVLTELEHWRANKSEYPTNSIPDKVWYHIFQLASEGRHGEAALRKIFGLNSVQYRRKKTELCATENSTMAELPSIEATTVQERESHSSTASLPAFGEVVSLESSTISVPGLHGTTKADLTQLKSNKNESLSFLDNSTIIVECIRPDGYRLKIHTTNSSLDTVMNTFFSQEVAAV